MQLTEREKVKFESLVQKSSTFLNKVATSSPDKRKVRQNYPSLGSKKLGMISLPKLVQRKHKQTNPYMTTRLLKGSKKHRNRKAIKSLSPPSKVMKVEPLVKSRNLKKFEELKWGTIFKRSEVDSKAGQF